ncbi:hypothetical protein ACOTVK_06555 [Aliarcobacter butzleri]
MTRPIQLDKTYGVLHTENYFSFLGFAKKVGSDETQKIDVYLDDKLIDNIEANEFIQKIDDMYDVESKAFTYNLPVQYIGKKAIISFKNHDSSEELLNSPYTLIDKNHEDFNEAIFIHSLEGSFDNEKIQNINPKDSIGFLGTEDNLLNKDFIKLINIFLEKNLNTKFKVFYFNKEQKKLISEKFNKYLSKIDFIMPKDIYDIASNTSIYIHSSTANEKPKSYGYHKTWQVLNQTKANMFMVNIFEEIDETMYSKSLKLVDNCKIEFEKSVISKMFENDDRYNEFRFMNSLNQPISKEIQNMYCPKSIGFLATKENLENEEFVEYIKQIMKDFPVYKFKAFFINKSDIDLIQQYLNLELLEIIELKEFSTILINSEIYLSHSSRTNIDSKILNYFRNFRGNVLAIGLNLNFKNLSVREFEKQYPNFFDLFFNNLNYFGFNEINTKELSFHTFFYNVIKKMFNVDLEISLEEYFHISAVYWPLIISDKNKNFKKFLIDFFVKNKELREKLN